MAASTAQHLSLPVGLLVEPLAAHAAVDLCNGTMLGIAGPPNLRDGLHEISLVTDMIDCARVDYAEGLLHTRFHGVGGRLFLRLAHPAGHIISGASFVEATLGAAQRIDQALRQLTIVQTGQPWRVEDEEALLITIDQIRDGGIGVAEFSKIAAGADFQPGAVGHHLMFAQNAHILTEQLRTAVLRTFDRVDAMHSHIQSLLLNKGEALYRPLCLRDEIMNGSMTSERIHGAFTEAVGGIATVLDLVYRLFFLLAREPFGSATLPGILHFPYHEAAKAYSPFPKGAAVLPTDLEASTLPFALPNLPVGSFAGLRGLRNDLTHNFASGHIQPITWIGYGTPSVSAIPIRYVIFLAPDIGADGKAVKHPFVERFYKDQRDGASILRALIEEMVLCVDHTLTWLAHRLEQRADAAGA